MILLVDNYDSFTYNLWQYIEEFTQVEVVRNDNPFLLNLSSSNYQAIVLSPGPGKPSDAGYMIELIQNNYKKIPILGICLGHQAIVESFGGEVDLSPRIMHGKISQVKHNNSGIFRGLPKDMKVMRYHSLSAVEEVFPKDLAVDAIALDDNTIQACHHNKYPTYGVQFHPESIGTPSGLDMIKNFIRIIGR